MRRFFLAFSVSATGLLCAATVAGVPAKVPVWYEVEFETTGPWEDKGCSGAGGSDKLTGKIKGDEPMTFDEDSDYEGVLRRVTKVRYCSARSLPSGEAKDCGITITGSGDFAVVLTVSAHSRGGYLKAKKAASPLVLVSGVTGDCDPAEMDQIQSDYGSGETAGTPNGQPIAVNATDSLRVKTYPPNLAANEQWTLKVIRRLP